MRSKIIVLGILVFMIMISIVAPASAANYQNHLSIASSGPMGPGLWVTSDISIYVHLITVEDVTTGVYSSDNKVDNFTQAGTPILYGNYTSGHTYMISVTDQNGVVYGPAYYPAPPSVPTGVSISGSGGTGILSWNSNPSGDNVTFYKVYENGSYLTSVTGTTYNFSGLLAGTYDFTVSAGNTVGESPQSPSVNYTVLEMPELIATPGNAQVTLSWNSVTGATGYNIGRATTSGGIYTTIASNVSATTYNDTNLTNGTTYYYIVSATSASGGSDNSAEVPATPQALASSSPTNLVATANSDQIGLTWTAATGATGYNVKRSTTAGGPYTSIAQNVSGASYTDTSVTAAATYYYVVTAITSGGESANSNEASATVLAPTDDRLYILLDINEQAQLSVSDNLSDNATLTWTSSDPTLATVDANGEVTAIKEGECKITATNSDGTFTDYIPVKVMKGAENFRLALNLKAGDSKRLWISDDSSSVSWTTMDPSVATIDNTGKITAMANGLCIVQGEFNGKTYYIYVRVN